MGKLQINLPSNLKQGFIWECDISSICFLFCSTNSVLALLNLVKCEEDWEVMRKQSNMKTRQDILQLFINCQFSNIYLTSCHWELTNKSFKIKNKTNENGISIAYRWATCTLVNPGWIPIWIFLKKNHYWGGVKTKK